MAIGNICKTYVKFSASIWIICYFGFASQAASKNRFEAAFQGGCSVESPCKQVCFDLHDGTHECACNKGFYLDNDGYSCIEETKTESGADVTLTAGINSDDGREEVVIVVNDRKSAISPPESASLVKSTNYEDRVYSSRKSLDVSNPEQYEDRDAVSNDLPKLAVDAGIISEQDLTDYLKRQSDLTSHDENPVYWGCDQLECESGGVCVEVEDLQFSGGSFKRARCKCPLGRGGFFCENVITLKYPKFLGWSYMGYPLLTDAYYSMQITMEFRPENPDGLILYSGESSDLIGDMISISLVNSYIEFRFDCGMGIGMLLSDRPIKMNDWNSLTIYREGWKAWMQLNDGMQVEGRSRGLFSRITFRERLYLGGSPDIEVVSNRTASLKGYTGCFRRLEVNNRIYDFSVPGYVVEGVDVAECSADVCGKLVCQNGGQCVIASPDEAICLCPLGFNGKYCQQKIHIEVPHFNGSSYLKYPGLASSVLSFTEIEVVFKPQDPDGVLLYNGYKPNSGDFIAVNLIDGFVEFRFNLGSGTAVLRSLERIEMNRWHTVFISRTGRDGMMIVDNQSPMEGLSPGAFTQLSLPLNFHLGGVSDMQHVTSHARIKKAFTGCIQKVTINGKRLKLTEVAISGVNIDNCNHSCVNIPCQHGGVCEPRAQFYTCHCNLGFSGFECEEVNKDTIMIPMFNGKSYLKYDNEDIMKRIIGNRINLRVKFKSYASTGLLVWSGKAKMSSTSDYLALGIKNGYVTFQYNLGSGEVVITSNSTRVDDGRWHIVQAMRAEQNGFLLVDNDPSNSGESPGGLVQLNVNDGLFIGGLDEVSISTNRRFKGGLMGCISNITIATDYHMQLVKEATSGLNIQSCS